MAKTNYRKTLLEALEKVNPEHELDSGICIQVRGLVHASETDKVYRRLRTLMNKWPEASGDPAFPVPSESMLPHLAYHRFKRWNPGSAYGQARRRLLAWLIAELQPKTRAINCKDNTKWL